MVTWKLTAEVLVKILVPIESVKLDYFIDIIYTIAKPEKPGYTEEQHLKDVAREVASAYEKIKQSMLQLDRDIKFIPQKYRISIRKTGNFAYVELRKKKMHIVIMLPYEVGSNLIKRRTITKLSESVQNWYDIPCFQITVENEAGIEEVVRALEEAYRQSQNLTQIR